jgi:hypothetical protein
MAALGCRVPFVLLSIGVKGAVRGRKEGREGGWMKVDWAKMFKAGKESGGNRKREERERERERWNEECN